MLQPASSARQSLGRVHTPNYEQSTIETPDNHSLTTQTIFNHEKRKLSSDIEFPRNRDASRPPPSPAPTTSSSFFLRLLFFLRACDSFCFQDNYKLERHFSKEKKKKQSISRRHQLQNRAVQRSTIPATCATVSAKLRVFPL